MKKVAFGDIIKKERERQGLSLSAGARAMGVSAQYLRSVESLGQCPSLDRADQMLKGLGISAVIGTLDRKKRVALG